MQRISLEYLAGFFDGEGSISLVHSASRTRQGNAWPVLICALAQVNPAILKRVARTYGGYLHYDRSTPRGCWKYSVSSKKAEGFLTALYPHLRLKQAEARAALKYRATFQKSNRRLRPKEITKRKLAIAIFHTLRKQTRRSRFSPRKPN